MKSKRAWFIPIICLALAGALAPAAEFTPTKEITVVVPGSPGGGSDLNARTIASIVQKHNLSPRSLMVVNNPGGSGAVALNNLFVKRGDAHTLLVLNSGQFMGSYVHNWNVKGGDLTYIAILATDNLFLCVRKDSGVATIEEFIAKSKAEPEGLSVGGSQRGNTDHLCFELTNRDTEAGASYVSFNSSADVMSALLGSHIDAGIFNPIECIGQIQAGDVVPIASFADKRLGGLFEKVPTFAELGYPHIVVIESRAIHAPPGIAPEVIEYYQEMMRKVTETDEWKKDYIEKNYLGPVFYDAAQTEKYYTDQIDTFKTAFEGLDVN